jgi:hypothetical protein
MAAKRSTPTLTAAELEVLESVDAEAEVVRENRRDQVLEAPFNPNSLHGSWALYHSDDKTRQALIVAEPQPGTYLVEFYDVVTDEPREQVVMKLEQFAKIDDDGGSWAFYDDRSSVRAAFKAMLA